jgi:hypothetical protein
LSYGIDVTTTWEEVVSVLMERYCHYSVGAVKGFFYSIAVVDVYVDVEYSLEVF